MSSKSENPANVKTNPIRKPFIPSWFDDYGLDPDEWRITCHIIRRGDCFESVDNIAKHCGIGIYSTRMIIACLTRWHVLERQLRHHETSKYRFNSCSSQWASPQDMKKDRENRKKRVVGRITSILPPPDPRDQTKVSPFKVAIAAPKNTDLDLVDLPAKSTEENASLKEKPSNNATSTDSDSSLIQKVESLAKQRNEKVPTAESIEWAIDLFKSDDWWKKNRGTGESEYVEEENRPRVVLGYAKRHDADLAKARSKLKRFKPKHKNRFGELNYDKRTD